MKKLLLILIILSTFFIYTQGIYADSLNIEAGSCILIDSKSGQVLYEQDSDKRLYPASVTKMMTAILALEKGKLDQKMTASQAAIDDIGPDGMNVGIMAGEVLTLEDLLHLLLIKSANETANIIAENICPTRKEFVALMNKKAVELGAINTNFVNPCGKDDSKEDINHLTTAADLAKIARYAMTLPKFREIVGEESYDDINPTNKHDSWPALLTTNKLLRNSANYPFKVIGIKTGFTNKAGNNLVSSAVNSDGTELIAVVMDVKSADAATSIVNSSKRLLEYGFKNYSTQKIIDSNQFIKNVPVVDSSNGSSLDLMTSNELKAVLPVNKNDWNLVRADHLNLPVKAPVKKGDILGYIDYKRNGVDMGKVNIVASSSIDKSAKAKAIDTAKHTVGHPLVRNAFIFVMSILLVFFALRFTLRKVSRMMIIKKRKMQ